MRAFTASVKAVPLIGSESDPHESVCVAVPAQRRPYYSGMTRRVAVVPHTHWDREWYQPFQTFRLQLVDLLDDLLPLLEQRPRLRPLHARRADGGGRRLPRGATRGGAACCGGSPRAAGSSMGPWYILMDEFLVSGETMVRDLQLGFERAAAFGGAMPVGYLPDMFGHIAQMPQLLRQFGLRARGRVAGRARLPSIAPVSGGAAPDGSTVRAEYLLEGYGNGAAIPDDAKALVARVTRFDTTSWAMPARRCAAALDERHRPPGAAALARPGRRGGQRDRRTTTTSS